jgi:hypothetical protein
VNRNKFVRQAITKDCHPIRDIGRESETSEGEKDINSIESEIIFS